MSLPKINLSGRRATISMMELRSAPGEVIDCVARGMKIDIEKNGKKVGTIIPTENDSDTTIIHSDGTITGAIPLTFRCDLGNGGYN